MQKCIELDDEKPHDRYVNFMRTNFKPNDRKQSKDHS